MSGTYVLKRYQSGIELGGNNGNSSLLLGAGTSSNKMTTSVANTKFMEFRLENSATSGDNRAMYLRFYLSGAGGGGEAARIFTTVNNVAAGTAHGAHISLNFGTSGTVTGQGIAGRNTLHLPNAALTSNVTMAAVQAEIYSDGSDSDPGGSTLLSYFRAVNDGHADGKADVDDDVALIEIIGHTIAAGNMLQAETDETKFSHKARIRIAGTDYFIMLTDS
jgi:hypothetical protein